MRGPTPAVASESRRDLSLTLPERLYYPPMFDQEILQMAEASMRWGYVVLLLLMATVWVSCSSTRWVHPTKKEEHLTYDWNKCERDWINLQATSSGAAGIADNATITRQRIARCLQKQGWRQIEDE